MKSVPAGMVMRSIALNFFLLCFFLASNSLARPRLVPDDIPVIPIGDIKKLKLLPADNKNDPQVGLGTEARYIGRLGVQNVHVRIANDERSLADLFNEVRNSRKFKSKGVLVPEYFGITELPDGKLGVVSEMIEGHHINFSADFETLVLKGLNVTAKTIEDMENARSVMRKLLLFSFDGPQFRVRKSDGRAFLIDLEFYTKQDRIFDQPNVLIISALKEFLPKSCRSYLSH